MAELVHKGNLAEHGVTVPDNISLLKLPAYISCILAVLAYCGLSMAEGWSNSIEIGRLSNARRTDRAASLNGGVSMRPKSHCPGSSAGSRRPRHMAISSDGQNVPLRVPSRATYEPQCRLHEARRRACRHTRLEGFAHARCGTTNARQNR